MRGGAVSTTHLRATQTYNFLKGGWTNTETCVVVQRPWSDGAVSATPRDTHAQLGTRTGTINLLRGGAVSATHWRASQIRIQYSRERGDGNRKWGREGIWGCIKWEKGWEGRIPATCGPPRHSMPTPTGGREPDAMLRVGSGTLNE